MVNFKSILYFCDILGIEPKLRIFGNDNYKSTFSSILSIIIIFLSATFTVYSFIIYFNYINPSIIYSKDNDKSTSRTIQIKDALLLLGLYENTHFSVVDKNDAFIEAEYTIEYNNGTNSKKNLVIEKCEYGKNIDFKHQDYLKNYPINYYYCFSNIQGSLPLFYIPDEGKSSISLNIRLGESSRYTANDIILYIINGNDVIDHSNKNNPISNNYFTSTYTSFSSNKFNIINFFLQFIKYESDDGILFPNNKLFKAKAFSQITVMETNYIEAMDKSEIGTVFINLSEINFDSYKRVYPRIQSLLAEITSVSNLLLVIGQILSKILLDKKMSKDIFKYIEEKEYKERKIKPTSQNKEIMAKEVNICLTKEIEKTNRLSNQESVDYLPKKNESNGGGLNISHILEGLNFVHIIKSFFCCKDEKTEVITACHKYISEEICIEKILKKLHDFENKLDIASENEDLEELKKVIFKNNKKL